MIVEKLWENLFANPSQWWDHRLENVKFKGFLSKDFSIICGKGNVRYRNFKHKETQEALWLDGKFKPSWVDAELAGLPPALFKCSRHVQVYKHWKKDGVSTSRLSNVGVSRMSLLVIV
ncbi:unnamed protein product [Sphagnum tenellum]